MDNRAVFAVGASRLEFGRPGMAKFPDPDAVSLTDPARSTFGSLETRLQTADIDNVYATFEDRLKITPTFALIAGLRIEEIDLDRDSREINGPSKPGFPFSKTWRPATGRIGYTWEFLPGLTWYSQVATAADVAANNIFLLGTTSRNLTRARTIETGLKQISFDKRASGRSLFEIERKNVYAAAGGRELNIAGKQISKGFEVAAAVRYCPAGPCLRTSPMWKRTTRTTCSPEDRSPAIRRRTCRGLSSMPARPIGCRPGSRSRSARPSDTSAIASPPMPTTSRCSPIRSWTPIHSSTSIARCCRRGGTWTRLGSRSGCAI
jgi:hypothetical protein